MRSCFSLRKAWNAHWVAQVTAKNNALWQAMHSQLQQEATVPFCAFMHVSARFHHSCAGVTGDSSRMQCDSPPVTLGDAGSYDSFRVTLRQVGSSTQGWKLTASIWMQRAKWDFHTCPKVKKDKPPINSLESVFPIHPAPSAPCLKTLASHPTSSGVCIASRS